LPPEVALAIAGPHWDKLTSALEREEESAAVLLAGVAVDEDRLVFTVNRIIWIPEQYYNERTAVRLSIRSGGWVPALKAAATSGLHPIFFHTHPGADPTPSKWDDEVDEALTGPFCLRARVHRYASFILGGTADRPSFTGRVHDERADTVPISHVRVVGSRLQMCPSFDDTEATQADLELHDRQVRAFGAAGQRALSKLRVGVVGAGGTGSAVLEQLVRLGVREIVSIDDDTITTTNVSRVYGSSLTDEGRPKVDVARDNAERIGLGTTVNRHTGRINNRAALQMLRTCDVIFGCTDDHTGRMHLSSLAYYYLVPVIDLGVAIYSTDGKVRSITGRVTYVAPGEACLVCRDVVDLARVREEAYRPEERERLAGEGYAQGLGEPDPSVIAYTTMVAAWGVADLFERLFGFGADDIPGELIIRIADRKMKGRRRQPNAGHICAQPQSWGLGDQPAFLGSKVWP
jgi:molybdopterin/thiamine biosynthesis adenylyltransferase